MSGVRALGVRLLWGVASSRASSTVSSETDEASRDRRARWRGQHDAWKAGATDGTARELLERDSTRCATARASKRKPEHEREEHKEGRKPMGAAAPGMTALTRASRGASPIADQAALSTAENNPSQAAVAWRSAHLYQSQPVA